jgi:hypothetical protein
VKRRAAVFLVLLGLTHMGASLAGWDRMAGVAAATGASPRPKVFSAVQGLETYSTRFTLVLPLDDSASALVPLTPALYARIEGPYNRRNVYGAVLAYGPVLVRNPATEPMWKAVARYALCGKAPILHELGIDPARLSGPVRIRLEPLNDISPLPTELAAPCFE